MLSCTEELPDAPEIVKRSIAYHDPQGEWSAFAERLYIKQETPGGVRMDQVTIDNTRDRFVYESTRDSIDVLRGVQGDSVWYAYQGERALPDSLVEKYRLSKAQIIRYRDYFGYLYGLPMKLNDPGTHVQNTVEVLTFFGQKALKVQVTYDEAVGKDVWYFYFSPETYRLLAYQFYHDQAANDGEYILLEGELLAGTIRLPQNRTWYTNAEDKLLGTDYLLKAEPVN